jgi:hypothetical protein
MNLDVGSTSNEAQFSKVTGGSDTNDSYFIIKQTNKHKLVAYERNEFFSKTQVRAEASSQVHVTLVAYL